MTELADPDDWPEPDETAERFASHYHSRRDEDGRGVGLDALYDERIDASQAAHQLQEVIVHLDAIADSGAFNDRTLDEVTKLHQHTIALHDWVLGYEKALSDELDDY